MKIGANYGTSGGPGYHLAALLYGSHQWKGFRTALAEEILRRLADFPESSARPLVLVGPSGGYCISTKLLERTGPILAVDVDPWARFAFFLGHFTARKRITWLREDFFDGLARADWSLKRWYLSRVKGARAGDATPADREPIFLFANLLGQLEFIYPERTVEKIERGLSQAFERAKLENISWVSVHDRLAFPAGNLKSSDETILMRANRRLATLELANRFGTAVEIEEHRMGAWAERGRGDYAYLAWPLTRTSVQIAEVTSSSHLGS
jgi:hypothetical protein